MSNSGAIKVKYSDGTAVYLYSHWGGDQLDTVARALDRARDRWSDEPYLARVLFSQMLLDAVSPFASLERVVADTTGFGISPQRPLDLDTDPVTVDLEQQLVITIKNGARPFRSVAETAQPCAWQQ